MKLLTKEQLESYDSKIKNSKKIFYICKEKLKNKYVKDKKYYKARDHCHYLGKFGDAEHSICNLKYSVPKKDHIAFHNKFSKKFTSLGQNTEKCIIFTVPIEKELIKLIKSRTDKTTGTDKNGEKMQKIKLTCHNLLICKIYGKLTIKSCQ